MTIAEQTDADVAAILSHRHDQGADWWTTPDRKLLKGAPFTTLESALYLLELGVPPDHEALRGVAQLIFGRLARGRAHPHRARRPLPLS